MLSVSHSSLKEGNGKKKGVDGEPFLPTVTPLLTSQLGEIDIHAAFFPTKSLFRLWDMMRKPFFPFL